MRAVSVSNRGGRENNEDCLCYAVSEGIWCFVVCDGLGGHECGEIASRLVCNEVHGAFLRNPELSGKALFRYLERAASVLGEKREDDESNMATTVAALITDGSKAVWAHIGDSRIYRLSGGEIITVTDDHSAAFAEFKSGEITYDGIRRSFNQNKLTRSMTDVESLNPDITDVTELKNGDAFLICSDGFWELVTEDDIENAISGASSPKEWLENMLAVLHENESERNDNYTAIAVMV